MDAASACQRHTSSHNPNVKTLLAYFVLAGLCGGMGAIASDTPRILVFSKTTLFRHASITNGVQAIRELGARNGFAVDSTEDARVFSPTNLSRYHAVVFLSTSGDILDNSQQLAFREYLELGGGLAAIHAAVAGDVATEGSWAWYGNTLCASFTNHSEVVVAEVVVEVPSHPSTSFLPKRWKRTDEWYNFVSSPRRCATILACLDESTYKGGTMGKDHPVAWCKEVGRGRVWYTALGHTEESFTEPLFLKHLLGGISYAMGG